jgi:hypothetical protein
MRWRPEGRSIGLLFRIAQRTSCDLPGRCPDVRLCIDHGSVDSIAFAVATRSVSSLDERVNLPKLAYLSLG